MTLRPAGQGWTTAVFLRIEKLGESRRDVRTLGLNCVNRPVSISVTLFGNKCSDQPQALAFQVFTEYI